MISELLNQKETNKMSKKTLSKFEKTRLLSARALELENGAEAKIDLKKHGIEPKFSRDHIKVAEIEFDEGKLDLELYE